MHLRDSDRFLNSDKSWDIDHIVSPLILASDCIFRSQTTWEGLEQRPQTLTEGLRLHLTVLSRGLRLHLRALDRALDCVQGPETGPWTVSKGLRHGTYHSAFPPFVPYLCALHVKPLYPAFAPFAICLLALFTLPYTLCALISCPAFTPCLYHLYSAFAPFTSCLCTLHTFHAFTPFAHNEPPGETFTT